jgi:ubiquinone/menaquinone biosynthesis C-methylase UbiE
MGKTTLWWRAVAGGFRLLYNELAWLYDPVSWIVSLGRWRKWQYSIFPFLLPIGRVLEVGAGPGHVLAALAVRQAAGQQNPPDRLQPVGMDLSPAMLRLARRRLMRHAATVSLCRGRAEALPFAPQSFDAVIAAFPTSYVYSPAWIADLARVLNDGGQVIIVEMAYLLGRRLHVRILEWLFRVTGQRGPEVDLPTMLGRAGLTAQRERVEVDGTLVSLVIASKRGTTAPLHCAHHE